MTHGEPVPLERFFAERDPASRAIFDVARQRIDALNGVEMRVTKSQVAWRRRTAFAWAWIPEQYLTGHSHLAPLVLSVALPRQDGSPRWKQIVEPRPGHFIHHLELRSAAELDDEVLAWLAEAWDSAE